MRADTADQRAQPVRVFVLVFVSQAMTISTRYICLPQRTNRHRCSAFVASVDEMPPIRYRKANRLEAHWQQEGKHDKRRRAALVTQCTAVAACALSCKSDNNEEERP